MQPILRFHYLKILFFLSYSSKQENKKKRATPESLSPVSAPLPKLFSEATLTKANRIELPVKQKLKQQKKPHPKQTPKQKRNVVVFSHLVAA